MDIIDRILQEAGYKISSVELTDEMKEWFKNYRCTNMKRMFDDFSKKFNINDAKDINQLMIQYYK